MELLDKIVEVLGDEKMTLAEYQEILEAGFAEASVGIIPPTADQVLIGDNERSRLKDIRVLFFVGVNDGLIPRHDAGGGILSEYDREELERADAKLSPTARETMYQQKFHLYRNLTKPSERLYLSFAKGGRVRRGAESVVSDQRNPKTLPGNSGAGYRKRGKSGGKTGNAAFR